MQIYLQLELNELLVKAMTKFATRMQSFKSINNCLAKLRRGVDTSSTQEGGGMEKYLLREG